MIICSSSNIDLIQGVSGYGTAADGATDWRIENTATGVFNILNSPNLLTPNVSIIDAGNIGIGTIPVSGTNKLQVQGNLNVSGGYFVAGVAFKPATAVLADTATALATSRNIAGVGFTGAAAIDIPYFNLTNKITAGNGISLTTGSATTSPSVSTNLTAGNGITISAAASPVIASSQWVTTGANIYYNSGNVGIGTSSMTYSLEVSSRQPAGAGVTSFPLRITAGDQAVTNLGNNTATLIGLSTENGGGSSRIKCAIGHCRTDSADRGSIVFLCNNVNDSNPVTMSDERMRITSGGNVGIGTNNPTFRCHIKCDYDQVATGLHLDASDSTPFTLTIWPYVVGSGMVGWRFRVISHLGGTNTAIQISNTGSVFFPVGSSSASDSRIKKDIEDINDETALNKLLLIQPTTYNYIDEERNKGFGKVYGFIAQQIREVIPEAITIITKEIIPNIYKSCLINNKREVYHSIPLDTPIDTDIKIRGSEYKIKEIYEDYFVIDKDIDTDDAFVFGYSVDDFHTLNKDYIFTLNVCATQELHRRIEAQCVLLKSQEDRIKDLETKVATLMSSNAT